MRSSCSFKNLSIHVAEGLNGQQAPVIVVNPFIIFLWHNNKATIIQLSCELRKLKTQLKCSIRIDSTGTNKNSKGPIRFIDLGEYTLTRVWRAKWAQRSSRLQHRFSQPASRKARWGQCPGRLCPIRPWRLPQIA